MRAYVRAWRRTPGSIAFLLLMFPFTIAVMVVLITGVSAGGPLLIVWIGFPLLWLTLWIARGAATASAAALPMTGARAIEAPEWDRSADTGRRGLLGGLFTPMRSARYWAALVHQMIVQPVIATATFVVTVTWVSVTAGGLASFLWRPWTEQRPEDLLFGTYEIGVGADGVWIVEAAIYLAVGIVAAVTLPWVLAGCVALHEYPMRAMLGRWRSDDLRADLRAEAAARDAAVRAEDHDLRRLERDLHDGPQQGLSRLQMDLDVLGRRVESGDTAGAKALVAETRERAQAMLDELRALSAGVAPPLLTDRGPAAALAALAATAPTPVTVRIDPRLDATLEPEVARTVYFTVAELLTNTAKHAGAAAVDLDVAVAADAVTVVVADDGVGDARPIPGHGLAGLADRLAGVRGTVVVDSPVGGPTQVTVTVPVPTGTARAGEGSSR